MTKLESRKTCRPYGFRHSGFFRHLIFVIRHSRTGGIMFDLFSGFTKTCDGVSRRSLFKIGSLGGLMSLPLWLKGRAALARETQTPPRDVNCIFIWTHGGTSHHDTLDPKPQAPP